MTLGCIGFRGGFMVVGANGATAGGGDGITMGGGDGEEKLMRYLSRSRADYNRDASARTDRNRI